MTAKTNNNCHVPTLQSCFETTINLKENTFNFGTMIYLKCGVESQAINRNV